MGPKRKRDISLATLLKSAAIMASGIAKEFLPENPDELCDRFELLL